MALSPSVVRAAAMSEPFSSRHTTLPAGSAAGAGVARGQRRHAARQPDHAGVFPRRVGDRSEVDRVARERERRTFFSGGQSWSFDQVSGNALDRSEVDDPTSADHNADAPVGAINLKTQRALER